MSFTSIPILDFSLAKNTDTKPAFLDDLRHALVEVGFLYLRNVGIEDELFKRVVTLGKAFFDIPEEEKLRIEMKNAPSFLGYSRLSAEMTAGAPDHREQVDLSTEHRVPAPSAPPHHNLLAPNQWPAEEVLPGFRAAFAEYMTRMGRVSMDFTSLVAEAIGLPADAFDGFFDGMDRQNQEEQQQQQQQHKLKIVKYPDVSELGQPAGCAAQQGVGPHKDSMLSSYLLQASPHKGLQVQNVEGTWVDCPPVEGTLVVAIGQGLEALTGGVCVSTTHRVLSPAAGSGPRFSIPFFQGVRGDTTFDELEEFMAPGGKGTVPDRVREERKKVLERQGGRLDDVEFTFRKGGVAKTLGEATLRNRIKSHRDVAERWYPGLLEEVLEEQERMGRERAEKNKEKEKMVGGGEGLGSGPATIEAH